MIQEVSWQEYIVSCWPFSRRVWLPKIELNFFLLCYHYVDHCAMYTSALCKGAEGAQHFDYRH
jgi:hypothetical protein